jgi:hypothetical protein
MHMTFSRTLAAVMRNAFPSFCLNIDLKSMAPHTHCLLASFLLHSCMHACMLYLDFVGLCQLTGCWLRCFSRRLSKTESTAITKNTNFNEN